MGQLVDAVIVDTNPLQEGLQAQTGLWYIGCHCGSAFGFDFDFEVRELAGVAGMCDGRLKLRGKEEGESDTSFGESRRVVWYGNGESSLPSVSAGRRQARGKVAGWQNRKSAAAKQAGRALIFEDIPILDRCRVYWQTLSGV